MADQLGGAAGPQPPEGPLEQGHAQVAREPRREQKPVGFRHAAVNCGGQSPAGGMVAVVGHRARRADANRPGVGTAASSEVRWLRWITR